MPKQEFYVTMGRKFAIAAEFPDTDAGTQAANEFIETSSVRHGVIAVENGKILIAAMDDKGIKL